MLGGGAELVLHIGDISYANGDPDIWNTFMEYIEPYAAAAPYMLGIGNHEYDWRTGREKRHRHRHATDASGSDQPYDPDWGNYGTCCGPACACLSTLESGFRCRVSFTIYDHCPTHVQVGRFYPLSLCWCF